MYMDCLIPLFSYPEATSQAALRRAAALAGRMARQVTALRVDIELGRPANPLAVKLLDLDALVSEARKRSAAQADALTADLEAACRETALPLRLLAFKCHEGSAGEATIRQARCHDLTILPMAQGRGYLHFIAENVLFGTGRPTLVVPESGEGETADPGRVVVAWDGGRHAARALADALPLLKTAMEVRVVSVVGEKAGVDGGGTAELATHLAHHGIEPVFDTEEAGGRSAGTALGEYARRHGAGLLVMGAYGHSRLRDFILGGATRTLLAAPPVPILFSH